MIPFQKNMSFTCFSLDLVNLRQHGKARSTTRPVKNRAAIAMMRM